MVCRTNTGKDRIDFIKAERSQNSGQSEDASVPFEIMTYLEFLKTKIELATESGFEEDRDLIHLALKPHQKDAVACVSVIA